MCKHWQHNPMSEENIKSLLNKYWVWLFLDFKTYEKLLESFYIFFSENSENVYITICDLISRINVTNCQIYVNHTKMELTTITHKQTNMKCKKLNHSGRLVIVFKNCCLKRYENCSLKSIIEIHVFSVYKTKKCVWYHGLNYMFQCSKI